MRALRYFVATAVLLLVGASMVRAEVVVVMDARTGAEALSREDAINIFLGRRRVLPGGEAAFPVDLPGSSDLRAVFYRKLVDKGVSEINAYWARLHFTGKTRPPAEVASFDEVTAYVLGTKGGIGYLPREQVDRRLRIVLSLP